MCVNLTRSNQLPRSAALALPKASNQRPSHHGDTQSLDPITIGLTELLDLAFPAQQFRFTLDTPTVAGHTAISSYRAMTGNRHRQRIGGASAGYSPHRLGRTNISGYIGVTGRGTHRNFL